ncbi:recombinase family protein [Hornefia butyriciproducens]|uniref:recombinase family protein n=1 Tax=Hornefia butyriciproducens TaxID=2652293 RepID=UPI002A90DD8B|nr:recombinase family protein [Hornefia butyriciproducens]MDY5423433.1 recombinase family protein [Hornefia butyriciproducens]
MPWRKQRSRPATRTYINSNPEWTLAGIYADDGISGTNTTKRDAFNRMIEDCKAGKIDMIITKSISRFSRNTVDCLKFIRELKDINIAVFFEKENINSLDAKGEVLMTIMAALAQQESESLSANVRLGIQFRNQQGKVQVNHNRFLGYTKDENDKLVIEPEEAEIVKRIYSEYMDGASLLQIKRGLERDGIRNGAGNAKWHESNIKQILTNEKYIGDALLQKTYTKSILDKKRCKNEGQLPKYYVEGSHEPIIDKDVFLRVQAEMARRANIIGSGHRRVYSSKYALSSVVRCGHCGDIFRRIKWNNRGCRSTVWRCVSRVEKSGPACTARTIKEEDLHAAIVNAINDIWSNRQGVIQTVRDNILAVIDSNTDEVVKDIDERIQAKQQELLDAGKDQSQIDVIGDEILRLREERRAALTEAARKKGIQERLKDLASFLEAQPAAITEYSDTLVRRLIDTITVYDEKLVIEFKAGLKTEVEI